MKKFLKFILNFLLFIWQLPQNLVGILVWCYLKITGHKLVYKEYNGEKYILSNINWGVSLASFIFLYSYSSSWTVSHELGHRKQSKILGPLYLLLIGIPSASGNIYDRIAHKKWTHAKRSLWYYEKQPWERWANKLSNIVFLENGWNVRNSTNTQIV